MSIESLNMESLFGMLLVIPLIWFVGWWLMIGWKKNKKRGWPLKRRIVISIFVFLFSTGNMIVIFWRFVNDRLSIEVGGLLISLSIIFGIYGLGLETGNFHRYKGFWIYLLSSIVLLAVCVFMVYIKYIE